MSRTKQPTYSQALNELEGILKEIESEESDLDLLSEKVKRAVFLIGYCRNRLRQVEDEISKVIADQEPAEPGKAEAGTE